MASELTIVIMGMIEGMSYDQFMDFRIAVRDYKGKYEGMVYLSERLSGVELSVARYTAMEEAYTTARKASLIGSVHDTKI